MAVANSNFEELLKEAGFSVADGEIDCGITYSKENLNILVEKMLEKTAAYMAEANAVISGLEKIEDKTSESYAQLSENAALINKHFAKIQELSEKISNGIN